MFARAGLAASVGMLLAGCATTAIQANTAQNSAGVTSNDALAVPAEAQVHPDKWPAPQWKVPVNADHEARIKAIIARMSIEEKVGQILQADLAAVTPEDVRKYHLGSVLNGGNSGPYGNDLGPAQDWLKLADEFYAASMDESDGKQGIPIVWGTDAVHGHSNIIGATLFPHNVGLGAMRDPDLIEKIGKATAVEIRVTGQEWTFAPTITVPQDYRWGRAYEGYSSDPTLVASYVGRMIKGLQGPVDGGPMLKGPYVIASTKHFLADGGTTDGRDQGDAAIDEDTLIRVHGAPYVPAIEAGVGTVMTSFSSWNGVKIAGHRGLVTDVLKNRMNFGGFVVTDWNAHGQLKGCTNASCATAVNAGIDMYMAPDTWKDLYASLTAQVKSGEVPMARLDEAVARVLRVKMRLGLFEAGKPSSRPYSGQWNLLGAPEHRAIAREAVAKSLVLLKNQGSLLPLKPGANVLVAGDAADDIARQAGGWTLTWQGTGLNNSQFPGATSIWKGLESAVKDAGGSASLSPNGSYTKKPDVAVVVFGETPYAEFQGDIQSLQLKAELTGPIETMKKLKAQGIPVVAVMITGRPLYMNPALNAADAFVVAWLPGSEGAGVADVMVAGHNGQAKRDFTGKLPTAWPANAVHGGPTLYPFGYGLSARTAQPTWKPLSEDAGIRETAENGVYFARGVPASSWSLIVAGGSDGGTRITTGSASALDGRVTVTPVDYGIQEGARRFVMAGGGRQVVQLNNFTPVDVSRETNGEVLLLTTLRIDEKPASAMQFSLTSADGKTATVVAPELAALPVGEWKTVAVPLQCFRAGGADMSRVSTPFQLETAGRVTFSLGRVALGTVADVTVKCAG